MTSRICVLLVATAASLAGCEKSSGPEPSPSGALSGGDRELMANFPSGAHVLFGGNWGKLQKFIADSQGNRAPATKGMSKLIDCVAGKDNLKFGGAVTVTGRRSSTLRIAIGGVTPADVEGCAKGIDGVAFKASDDGKYFTVDSGGEKGGVAFLRLKDGTLYTRGEMAGGSPLSVLSPKFKPTPREDLEADVAAAAKASVLDDAKVSAAAEKADRAKTFWFAGSLAGASAPVGEAYGSIDLGDGLSFFLSAEITDSSMADQAERMYDSAKQMSDQMPAGIKGVFDELKLKRSGDRFTLTLNLSKDQVIQAAKSASALGLTRRL